MTPYQQYIQILQDLLSNEMKENDRLRAKYESSPLEQSKFSQPLYMEGYQRGYNKGRKFNQKGK